MKKLTAIGSMSLLMLAAFGCATAARKEVSAGLIGCPQAEIIISDEHSTGAGNASWAAECRGKRFYCSAGRQMIASCKEELKR
jgi:hypothetical protein